MNINTLLHGIEEYTESSLLRGLRSVINKNPSIDFSDCMSRNQIASKKWLVHSVAEHLGEDFLSIYILCGWYGVLAAMLTDSSRIKFKKIRSIDIDPSCEAIADQFNYELYKSKWQFKAFTQDIMNLDYENISLESIKENGSKAKIYEKPDLIINTSCEHIDDFTAWRKKLPRGLKVALQSNNFELHAQHVNCVESLQEFVQECELSQVLYKGTMSFDEYERYTLVGII